MGGGLPRKKGISWFLLVVQVLVFLACGLAINLLWATPHAEEHVDHLSTKETQIKASAKLAATAADPPRLRPEEPAGEVPTFQIGTQTMRPALKAGVVGVGAGAGAAAGGKVDPVALAMMAGAARKSSKQKQLDTANWSAYLARYDDLKKAFGDDRTKARQHFFDFGFTEGRYAGPNPPATSAKGNADAVPHNFEHVSSLPHTGSDVPDDRDMADRIRGELGAPSHIKKEMDNLLSSKKSGASAAVTFLKDLYGQRYHKENAEGSFGRAWPHAACTLLPPLATRTRTRTRTRKHALTHAHMH